ncbi:MAG: hypothetical protein A2413_12335 [Treponema sp. RIFOXYC1_FULL_61_9]|nr:MAG: hypothetical protein A2413_12335 [Treponema sp. RIFOXYC1_FULL_61_9]
MDFKARILGALVCAGIAASCSSVGDIVLRDKAINRFPLERPFPESSFVQVEGARLHIRQWEPDNSEYSKPKGIVYLIHGASGSTYNWRYLAPALSEAGWSVLTADLPPFGFSGEKQDSGHALDPLPQDSESRADLLWRLFDALHPCYSGNLVLAGHSLGGRIAAHMTLSRPDFVDKLVLLAPAVFGRSAIPGLAKYWPFSKVAASGASGVLGNMAVIRAVIKKAYGGRATEDDIIGNLAPFLRDGVQAACGEWARLAIDTSEPPLRLIPSPTLIMWSKDDAIVPNNGKKLQDLVNGSCYQEVPGGSHCIMDTDNEIIEPALLKFLTKDE